ncbi:hypothetical protein DAPPUDRAFT_115928 [Daphnia pulex]|uniref:Ig-like domain-containing protein n=1 Tax=Daphnia pulex TaxID=6669 RepID=E9HN01_DAPPU|nr:hypothetical protein DAPPUDRAFT_115928 [Daphnia pulex]|eukprot:EFX66880.1 hypothetical protein DAPPUDRAFT_115928 [Daphnia pulex]
MFACNFVKSMQLVFFFYFVRSYAQRIRLLPDVAEQVIDAGSNITLICIFEDLKFYSKISAVAPLSWELPDYIVKYPEESFVANRLVKTFDTNETHKISSLTLAQATRKDTGYFGCTGRGGCAQRVTKVISDGRIDVIANSTVHTAPIRYGFGVFDSVVCDYLEWERKNTRWLFSVDICFCFVRKHMVAVLNNLHWEKTHGSYSQ